MRKLLLATAAAVLLSTPTLAADLAPVEAEPMAPAYLPFSWTGFYVGGNVGYAWGAGETDAHGFDGPEGFYDDPGYLNLNSLNGDDGNGFTAGAQAGYNWQMGMFVVGVEGDINWADLDSDNDVSFDTSIIGTDEFGSANISTELNWYGTLRARLGVTPVERFLVYATGGLAFGSADTDVSGSAFFDDGVNTYEEFYRGSSSDTEFGWTIGGGLEYAFTDNWTIKAEYLFVDLGETDTNVDVETVTDGISDGVFDAGTITSDNSFHVGRVGVNYKF